MRVRGQDHGKATLTDHEVELIRQLHDEGMDPTEIAEKFDVTRRYVVYLVRFERRLYPA